jgi:ATP-dependent Clp protease ATP-binding subunit ClpC
MEENKDYLKKSLDVKASVSDDDDESYEGSEFRSPKRNSKSKTPVLDTYSRDLTKMAEEGKIDPVIGRDKEIARVSQILSRRKKNNPIIIGEPGTGKSSVADGLAQRIIDRKVSRKLFNKRVVMVDLASMVAGTKYRGQFEERVKALMSEVENDPNIILFIDEIHTMIGAGGSSGSMDASNMFKPALARGEIQLIGATTMEEYRKHIEKDGALERRFQKVIIEPTSRDETVEILNNIKEKYETHHNVTFTPEAIEACVDLTSRYVTDRFLPDKAIDALDEAGARVHISNILVPKSITEIENKIAEIKEKKNEVIRSQKYEEAAKLRDMERQLDSDLEIAKKKWEEESKNDRQVVGEDDVAQVVSMITGIPVSKIGQSENKKLVNMFHDLSGKVIGQDDAVRKVVKAIQRGRVGLSDPNKPVFSGILIGNSGVGKCVTGDTFITLRNKKTGEIDRLSISDLLSNMK